MRWHRSFAASILFSADKVALPRCRRSIETIRTAPCSQAAPHRPSEAGNERALGASSLDSRVRGLMAEHGLRQLGVIDRRAIGKRAWLQASAGPQSRCSASINSGNGRPDLAGLHSINEPMLLIKCALTSNRRDPARSAPHISNDRTIRASPPPHPEPDPARPRVLPAAAASSSQTRSPDPI